MRTRVIPEVGIWTVFKVSGRRARQTARFCLLRKGRGTIRYADREKKVQRNVLIGSEGGLAEEEIRLLSEKGVLCASLGKRILRCETAPLAALTLILHTFGEL